MAWLTLSEVCSPTVLYMVYIPATWFQTLSSSFFKQGKLLIGPSLHTGTGKKRTGFVITKDNPDWGEPVSPHSNINPH